MDFELNNAIKKLMLNSIEEDGFFKALELQYGKVIPLYHATDLSSYIRIKKEGLTLREGKNYQNWGYSSQIYFQIGRSDYLDSFRSVLLKYEAPVDWLAEFAYADLDNVTIKDEDLDSFDVDLESITTEMKDFLKSYIWNDLKIKGMEIMIMDLDLVGFGEVFPEKVF